MLKAVSSPLRLQILNLLLDKGPLSYTELMSSLKMNPSRDAGRFAYHLKFLLKADLLEADVETRKYCLTDLGKMILEVADRVEKKASKQKGIIIRASRFALEEFDANRIANSLIREAKVPAELAQKVAKEAEKRLIKSKTRYLTAPLVREIVNAILIEKGLEDYRHELTRLGLPVHEVAMLVEGRSKTTHSSSSVCETAGEAVLREYMLLKALPRDISDAHLSGAIHIKDLGSWTLKPSEIMHDLRFFYQNGATLEESNGHQSSSLPPHSFESALSLTLDVLLSSAKEVDSAQHLDYFNVFLAPFARGVEPARIKELLSLFISSITHHLNISIGLELTIPDFIAKKTAVGLAGKTAGEYGGFLEEAQLLASVILDICIEENRLKPLLNPKIVVKTRQEAFSDNRANALLLKAHGLAGERGTICFACLSNGSQGQTVFSGSGRRFMTESSGDWEIDTLRVGCLGTVTVNLPRIAYECEKDKTKFSELLKERLEIAARAFDVKYGSLKRHGKELLPFLAQSINGDQYFKPGVSSRLINLVGLKETVELLSGKSVYEDEKARKWMQDVIQIILDYTHKIGRKSGKRLLPAVLYETEASERLAQLDVDKYGLGTAKFSGIREKPFYSTVSRLALKGGQIPPEASDVERQLRGLSIGGSLAVIELGDLEYKPDELLSVTKQAVENCSLEFLTFRRRLTYCLSCKRSWFGLLHKCPSCNSIGALSIYDQYATS